MHSHVDTCWRPFGGACYCSLGDLAGRDDRQLRRFQRRLNRLQRRLERKPTGRRAEKIAARIAQLQAKIAAIQGGGVAMPIPGAVPALPGGAPDFLPAELTSDPGSELPTWALPAGLVGGALVFALLLNKP